MIAVSESTPGPMGVNMATYVGFHIGSTSGMGGLGGIVGAVVATLGLITPSIIVILIIARIFAEIPPQPDRGGCLSGLRPASTALIAAAGLSVAFSVFTVADNLSPDSFLAISWPSLLLAVAVFVGMKWTPLKKLHPIVFILASAVAGILLQL
ncbi:MAG: chromate transporter [Flavonifractor plautii]